MKKYLLIILTILIMMPFSTKALEIDNLLSKNVLVYDLEEDKILYEKNIDSKAYIASLTKIMTALIAVERIEDINSKVIITSNMYENIPWDASVSGFEIGDEVTYKDLLMGLMLPSGADAAEAIAYSVAGSEKDYVKLMNEKAKELKLENTNFVNVTGLHDDNHYSTVKDLLVLIKYALNNPTFKEIFTTKSYTTTNNLSFTHAFSYYARKISSDFNYVIGSKTGYTEEAGLCLVTLSKINNEEIITITLNALENDDRNNQVKDLDTIYNKVSESYTKKLLYKKDQVLKELKTKYAKEKNIEIKTNEDIYKYVEGEFNKDDVKLEYDGVEVVKYNTPKDTKLGDINIYYKDELVKKIEVSLENELHFSLWNFIKANIIYIMFIAIALFLLYVKIVNTYRRYKKRKRREMKLRSARMNV